MKTILSNVAIFAAGVVAGGFVMWCYIKPKLEEAIEKNMEKPAENEPEVDAEVTTSEQITFDDYTQVLNKTGYNAGMPETDDQKPYVITPEEFGETENDEVEFTLFADGILADECGNAIDDEDVEAWVGRANLERMGEHEKDVLYIRNNKQGTDYIICKDLSNYMSPETE